MYLCLLKQHGVILTIKKGSSGTEHETHSFGFMGRGSTLHSQSECFTCAVLATVISLFGNGMAWLVYLPTHKTILSPKSGIFIVMFYFWNKNKWILTLNISRKVPTNLFPFFVAHDKYFPKIIISFLPVEHRSWNTGCKRPQVPPPHHPDFIWESFVKLVLPRKQTKTPRFVLPGNSH